MLSSGPGVCLETCVLGLEASDLGLAQWFCLHVNALNCTSVTVSIINRSTDATLLFELE